MVNNNIELYADSKKIKLEKANKGGWYKVYFINETNNVFFLGAELLEYIKEKMIIALQKNETPISKYKIENKNVFFIITLSETHTCIFGNKEQNLTLYFMGDGEKLIGKMTLSINDCNLWIDIINSLE